MFFIQSIKVAALPGVICTIPLVEVHGNDAARSGPGLFAIISWMAVNC